MRKTLAILVAWTLGTGACGSGTSVPSVTLLVDSDIASDTSIEEVAVHRGDSGTVDASGHDVCVPDCENRECGGDGCGGECGVCEGDLHCVEFKGEAICESCVPQCDGKQCGEDGCGGQCGVCGSGGCRDGLCVIACESDACGLGKSCVTNDGTLALCGGVIDCDTGPDGKSLGDQVPVGEMFADAGVMFYTSNPGYGVYTNWWELDSESGGQSCATLDQFGNPWTGEIYVRFVVPTPSGYGQGATAKVSFFIGETWPGGLVAEFYGPGSQPSTAGSSPITQIVTGQNGTDIIDYAGQPVGWVRITFASDPDFTIDDLSFGPIHL